MAFPTLPGSGTKEGKEETVCRRVKWVASVHLLSIGLFILSFPNDWSLHGNHLSFDNDLIGSFFLPFEVYRRAIRVSTYRQLEVHGREVNTMALTHIVAERQRPSLSSASSSSSAAAAAACCLWYYLDKQTNISSQKTSLGWYRPVSRVGAFIHDNAHNRETPSFSTNGKEGCFPLCGPHSIASTFLP